MLTKNKHLIISMISSGMICVISAILYALFPTNIELALYWIQLGCIILSFACMIDCLRKDKSNLFLQFQVGAILCFALGLIYWVVHLTILGYDAETISISDISVIGFYLFLLSAIIMLDQETQNKGKMTTYKIIALTAPLFTLICGIIQILFCMKYNFGNVIYVTFYTAVFMPLSYFSLKFLLVPAKNDLHSKAMKPYAFVIFLILAVNVIWNLYDFINHGLIYLLCVFITSILLLFIVPTASYCTK